MNWSLLNPRKGKSPLLHFLTKQVAKMRVSIETYKMVENI